MTTRKFLEEKNKIVFEATGLILIPEDQLIDMEFTKLREDITDAEELADRICPYCIKFDTCVNCPMDIAGNSCDDAQGTDTWGEAVKLWTDPKNEPYWKELHTLVLRYNNEEGT